MLGSTYQHIVVTSATSLVGRMLIPRLKEAGYRVTALVRSAVPLPVDDLIVDWTTSREAKQALNDCDTIIHLSGEIQAKDWHGYYQANVQTTEIVGQALQAGQAQRVIFISYPNADPQSANLFLRAKGMAEQLLMQSGKAVVFRVQAIINTPNEPGPAEQAMMAVNGRPVQTLGDGTQQIFTIYRPDVVAAIVSALKRGKPGIYNLCGPDKLTIDRLIQLINRNPHVRIRHTPQWAARLLSRFVPDLPPTFVDLYFQQYQMDGMPAIAEFGLQPQSLQTIWR